MFLEDMDKPEYNFELDLEKMGPDLKRMMKENTKRGLIHIVSWAAELLRTIARQITSDPVSEVGVAEDADYCRAKPLFDAHEYDRAANFVKNSKTPVGKFLYYHSRYCSVMKKRLDDTSEAPSSPDQPKISDLRPLRLQLEKDHLKGSLDGYCLYLYGVVLKKLELHKKAAEVLNEALQKEPLLWGAWLEVSSLIPRYVQFNEISLPDCWFKEFVLGDYYLKVESWDEALNIYKKMQEKGFSNSSYVRDQKHLAYDKWVVNQ